MYPVAISNKYNILPENLQLEVNDFINFLVYKNNISDKINGELDLKKSAEMMLDEYNNNPELKSLNSLDGVDFL